MLHLVLRARLSESFVRIAAAMIASAVTAVVTAATPSADPIELVLDTSEAEQALLILDEQAHGMSVTNADWQRLFTGVPYQWLKAREASLGRSLTDNQFKTFLLSTDAQSKRDVWRKALAGMKAVDVRVIGQRVLEWLPADATLHARVFAEIKPQQNSFVWTKPGDAPTICLAVQDQSRDSVGNTVAHELHHIGLQSLSRQQDAMEAGLPERLRMAVNWMTAFGEGEAMLAAAGSVERHPHWEDDALIRARWDSDLMHFNSDLGAIQQMLLDILDGRLRGDADIRQRAAPFWGVQGAWYTVGYEMAALVEKRFGRQVFDQCLLDPRLLLERYNEVAGAANAQGASLATWSPELLRRLRAQDSAQGQPGAQAAMILSARPREIYRYQPPTTTGAGATTTAWGR